jgi:hypothetical protein
MKGQRLGGIFVVSTIDGFHGIQPRLMKLDRFEVAAAGRLTFLLARI